nr:60S ribosomal protein L39 [Polyrhizophydium stewartii]
MKGPFGGVLFPPATQQSIRNFLKRGRVAEALFQYAWITKYKRHRLQTLRRAQFTELIDGVLDDERSPHKDVSTRLRRANEMLGQMQLMGMTPEEQAFKLLIAAHARRGQVEHVQRLLEAMEACGHPTDTAEMAMEEQRAHMVAGDRKRGEQMVARISSLDPSVRPLNHLAITYALCRDRDAVLRILGAMRLGRVELDLPTVKELCAFFAHLEDGASLLPLVARLRALKGKVTLQMQKVEAAAFNDGGDFEAALRAVTEAWLDNATRHPALLQEQFIARIGLRKLGPPGSELVWKEYKSTVDKLGDELPSQRTRKALAQQLGAVKSEEEFSRLLAPAESLGLHRQTILEALVFGYAELGEARSAVIVAQGMNDRKSKPVRESFVKLVLHACQSSNFRLALNIVDKMAELRVPALPVVYHAILKSVLLVKPSVVADVVMRIERDLPGRDPSVMPSIKSFRTKRILGKKQKQNRPIPNWIRFRTDNTIRYNAKRRNWRRTKLNI